MQHQLIKESLCLLVPMIINSISWFQQPILMAVPFHRRGSHWASFSVTAGCMRTDNLFLAASWIYYHTNSSVSESMNAVCAYNKLGVTAMQLVDAVRLRASSVIIIVVDVVVGWCFRASLSPMSRSEWPAKFRPPRRASLITLQTVVSSVANNGHFSMEQQMFGRSLTG